MFFPWLLFFLGQLIYDARIYFQIHKFLPGKGSVRKMIGHVADAGLYLKGHPLGNIFANGDGGGKAHNHIVLVIAAPGS